MIIFFVEKYEEVKPFKLAILKMNKSGEKKREQSESTTFLSTMARVPLKSNFSINAILPEIADRDTPPNDDDGSPAPSAPSEMDDASSDGDVNVDYESENEGKHPKKFIPKIVKI